tara:strand:+ start:173 stop:424 length:252 start_codon:yes stop_codon:yes gene_type:complete
MSIPHNNKSEPYILHDDLTMDRERHGGPYDRGSADAYYGRPFDPHYYVGNTYQSPRIEVDQLTEMQIAEYSAGYDEEEDRKEW